MLAAFSASLLGEDGIGGGWHFQQVERFPPTIIEPSLFRLMRKACCGSDAGDDARG